MGDMSSWNGNSFYDGKHWENGKTTSLSSGGCDMENTSSGSVGTSIDLL